MEKYCWFKEDERTHEKKEDAKSEQKTNRIISDRNTEYKEEEKQRVENPIQNFIELKDLDQISRRKWKIKEI